MLLYPNYLNSLCRQSFAEVLLMHAPNSRGTNFRLEVLKSEQQRLQIPIRNEIK